MNISAVNPTNNNSKFKKIGTAAGVGVGSIHVIKNAKDTFAKVSKIAAEKAGGNKTAYAVMAGGSAVIIGGAALIGRAVGSLVDKITQKTKENATKNALAKVLSEQIAQSDMNVVKLDDLEAMLKEDLKGMSPEEIKSIMQEQ